MRSLSSKPKYSKKDKGGTRKKKATPKGGLQIKLMEVRLKNESKLQFHNSVINFLGFSVSHSLGAKHPKMVQTPLKCSILQVL
jgi:hypothetical protein